MIIQPRNPDDFIQLPPFDLRRTDDKIRFHLRELYADIMFRQLQEAKSEKPSE